MELIEPPRRDGIVMMDMLVAINLLIHKVENLENIIDQMHDTLTNHIDNHPTGTDSGDDLSLEGGTTP